MELDQGLKEEIKRYEENIVGASMEIWSRFEWSMISNSQPSTAFIELFQDRISWRLLCKSHEGITEEFIRKYADR